jgi:adenylosuccinate synthase
LPAYPDRVDVLAGVEPDYETLPGWGVGLGEVREAAGLPAGARQLIQLIEEQVGVPVRVVGVGAERDDYLIWQ